MFIGTTLYFSRHFQGLPIFKNYFHLFLFKLNLVKVLLGLPRLLSRYCDPLQAGRFRFSRPGCGAIFRSIPDQPRRPPSFLENGYWCLLPEVKQPDHGAGYPLPSNTQVKERIEVDFDSHCVLCPLRVELRLKQVTNIDHMQIFIYKN